jgi:hypothetical protein
MNQSPRFPWGWYMPIGLMALLLSSELIFAGPFPQTDPNRASDNPTEAKDSPQPSDLLAQGEKLLLDGQYAQAAEHFSRAISQDPHDPRARGFLAFSQFAMGDFQSAALTAHDVMKMAPDLATTPLDIHELLGDSQTIEKQLLALNKIAELQPPSSQMRYLLGFMQFFSGDPVRGVSTLLDYMDANPEDWTIRPFVSIARNSINPEPRPTEPRSIEPPPTEPPPAVPFVQHPTRQPRAEQPDSFRLEFQARAHVQAEPSRRPPIPSNMPPPSGDADPQPSPRGPVSPLVGESDNLVDIAINEFCHAHRVDPVNNQVVAILTDEYFDDDTGSLIKAKFKMRWVEWKIKKDKHGVYARKAKQKSETVKLRFDERGRLTDYDD